MLLLKYGFFIHDFTFIYCYQFCIVYLHAVNKPNAKYKSDLQLFHHITLRNSISTCQM